MFSEKVLFFLLTGRGRHRPLATQLTSASLSLSSPTLPLSAGITHGAYSVRPQTRSLQKQNLPAQRSTGNLNKLCSFSSYVDRLHSSCFLLGFEESAFFQLLLFCSSFFSDFSNLSSNSAMKRDILQYFLLEFIFHLSLEYGFHLDHDYIQIHISKPDLTFKFLNYMANGST